MNSNEWGNRSAKGRSRRSSLIAALLALVAGLAAAAPAAAKETLTVAVFNFESREDGARELGSQMATLLNANLSAEPELITLERAELEKLLGEQELGLSGTVSPDTAAKVGHLTGAKVIVTGRIFHADKEIVAVAKIIGTETSRVYGELVKGGAKASVTELAEALAKKIAVTLAQKGDTLVAKVPSHEERIAAIKKSLKEGPLPSVSVKITERHIGQPIIDPAAEIEIGLLLKECGFKLADASAAGKADIEITGEAFSAYGLRKGNLFSCRARIELKAQKPGGEILAIDRQTSVGIDIAEQTAAKTALQNAAAEIGARILPKLVK